MEKGLITYLNQNDRVTAKQQLVNYMKIHSLLNAISGFFQVSLEAEHKKIFFGQSSWRFSKKAKGLVVFAIIAVMLISIFTFLPKVSQSATQSNDSSTDSITVQGTINQTSTQTRTQTSTPNPLSQASKIIGGFTHVIPQILEPTPTPKPPGLIALTQTMNTSVWQAVAVIAWSYFAPGTGTDSRTGLPWSASNSPCFTDWDLGVYIQSVLDAQKIGLIGTDGTWNASDRLNKVLTFLENRELNATTHYPYWFYQSGDGKNDHADSDLATDATNIVDDGRLFVALNNLKAYNSSWVTRINNLVYNVYNNRSDYAVLVPSIKSDSLTSTSVYAYYVYSGFASFWPNELSGLQSRILNNIFSAGNASASGIWLPRAEITCDPLLCSVFELNNTDSRLMVLMNQVYLAHEAYFNTTGQYRAFSEGPSLKSHWAYEWVVLADNRTWVVLTENNTVFNMDPIIFTKVSMSFLAIYNSTFATDMTIYLENALSDPVIGFFEGVDESGVVLEVVGSNTNSLILDAALYTIQNNK